MKYFLLVLGLTLAGSVTRVDAAFNDGLAAELAAKIEARLTVLFQEKDVLASDHAVLLATHYRRTLAWAARSGDEVEIRARLARLLTACEAPPPRGVAPGDLVRVDAPPALVDNGDRASLRDALAWALAAARKDKRTLLPFGLRDVRRADIVAALELFAKLEASTPDSRELAKLVAARFDVYRSPGLAPSGDVLFTAYHQPVLSGRLTREGAFKWPVYRAPATAGLDNTQWSRAEVARGALAGNQLEIAYLADPLDAYLLEIEGSGTIRLPDGRTVVLAFAAKNGQPYKSLGKAMVRLGMVKPWEMSIPAIRQALVREPGRLREVFDLNPSQIYFDAKIVDEAPRKFEYVGERSVACDQGYLPRAGIGFALLERPDVQPNGALAGWVPHHRWIFNHDTGSAIRGPGHIDLYWGHAPDSGIVAGSMREPGSLYYLLSRGTPLSVRR